MPRLIFNDEVGERYHDLDGKHDSDQRGPGAVPLIPGEGKEKISVQKLPRGMQREFAGRRSFVRKAFRDFVMPEGKRMRRTARRLRSERGNDHGAYSRFQENSRSSSWSVSPR